MWNSARLFGLLFLFACPVFAQNPQDITFSLTARNGQTAFRLGEAIPVKLCFQSDASDRYQVITDPSQRIHLNGLRVYDRFKAEPPEAAVDPLREQTRMVEAFVGAPPRKAPLTSNPTCIDQAVNDWISFRKPGTYRVTANSSRLSLIDRSGESDRDLFPKPIAIQSNPITIEIVQAEEVWANRQLQQAVALLSQGLPEPALGRVIDVQREKDVLAAARVLRFLDTKGAALAMVRFFDSGLYIAQGDLTAGLYGSPYREDIISALEEGLSSNEVSVTHNWIDTLSELATAHEFGPAPPYDKDRAGSEGWNRHFVANRERYMAILAASAESKQGLSKAVSLEVLSNRRNPQPAPPESIAAVVENFLNLPENTQNQYLTINWSRIASPNVKSLVLTLAKGSGQTRDTALMRLQELDPEAARPIILDRIGKGDIPRGPFSDPRTLLSLSDQILPEMDLPLVTMLEQGKNVADLISRYSSDAIFSRVQAWVDAAPNAVCGPILSYLFRVRPAYAAEKLESARKAQPNCLLPISPIGNPFISPGLEKAVIAGLASPDIFAQRVSLTILEKGGSAAAEADLWNGLKRLHDATMNSQDREALEGGYIEALTRSIGWILTPEKLDQLATQCISDSCRRNVESIHRHTGPPIGIVFSQMITDTTSVTIGSYSVHGTNQLEAKIGQFPRGTQFYFPSSYKGNWYYEQRIAEVSRLLNAAGMQIVEQPAAK